MTPDQWHKVKAIVQEALEMNPEERSRFLAERCGDDDLVRSEAAALLREERRIGDFIESPAALGSLAGEQTVLLPAKLAPGLIVGRYKIESLIGAGGMGEVYLAHDTRLRRKIAIKVLPANLAADHDRLRRFEQEAQAASALNHPNIITIHEIGEADGLNFIATEYIEGVTLSERLQCGQMGLEEVLNIATQISSALQAAHRAGIVHRDIKPDNVMIRPDGLVKILDFGIAKLTDQHVFGGGADASVAKKLNTQPGVVIGTASYMSPEQARGLDVDGRTDIWSLGVVLYEMVGGRPPFSGETLTDTIVAIIEKEPPPLKSVTSRRIPGRLETVIRKALHKEPSGRFQTTGEMLVDIDAIRRRVERGESLIADVSDGPSSTAVATEVIHRRDNTAVEASRARTFTPLPAIAVAAVLLIAVAASVVYRTYVRGSANNVLEINSLAVLPLKSLSTETDYLGLGVADAVIRRVSQTGKVIVRPTNAVRRYMDGSVDSLEAARQLNVDAVLDGTFQRSGDRLRVSVELTRASDGALLWAESFDTRAGDIFAVQDRVSQQVVSRLQLRLDPEQQTRLAKKNTSNPEAYEYYVKGVSSLDLRRFGSDARPQLEATIGLFEKAVAADLNYALARAQLAYCYAWMAIFIDPIGPEWIQRSRDQLAAAEAIDPEIAEIYMTRYLIYFSAFESFQIEEAVRQLRRAQEINPNVGHDELGNLFFHLGLEDLGEKELQRALEVDPTSEYVKNTFLGSYRIVKLFDKWDEADRVLLDGRTKPNSWILISQGRVGEAEQLLADELAKSPDDPVIRARKALLLAVKKDFRQAEEEIRFVLNKYPLKNLAYHHLTYDLACVYALAGRSDEAMKWLHETVDTGFYSYPLFERDPFLDPIRQTSDFKSFMADMQEHSQRYRNEFSL